MSHADGQAYRAIGWVAWAVVLGGLFALEGYSLARGRGWPSLSDMFRAISTPVAGRWILFAGWLWLGWHLFIRGWRFFLGGPAPGAPPVIAASAMSLTTVLVRVVAPMLVLFALTVGLLVRFGRRQARRISAGKGLRALLVHLGVTIAGGYIVFAAVNALLAAGGIIHGTLTEALTEGALLTFVVVVPGFAVLTVLDRVQARLRTRDGNGAPC